MSDLHMFHDYEHFYDKVENSQIFSRYCEAVYGVDFSQDGFADLKQITELLSIFPLTVDSKLLDIGCGNGKLCKYIHERTGADVYGFDYSPAAITSAKRQLKKQAENFEVAAIDSQEYPDMIFDVIISIDTLYFTDDLHALIRKITRWLKPGGIFAAFYMDDNQGQNKTELAQALQDNKLNYEVADYSACHFRLMRRKHDTVLDMWHELDRDGLGEHAQRMLRESFDENVTIDNVQKEPCCFRYLYWYVNPDTRYH